MILFGEVYEMDWLVVSEVVMVELDGFCYWIYVMFELFDGVCECEVVIDGLCVGMMWIEMKKVNIFMF